MVTTAVSPVPDADFKTEGIGPRLGAIQPKPLPRSVTPLGTVTLHLYIPGGKKTIPPLTAAAVIAACTLAESFVEPSPVVGNVGVDVAQRPLQPLELQRAELID